MFNKEEYRKNRAEGRRGQAVAEVVKVYEKGDTINYVNREGQEAEYPNARGQHLIRVPGKGLQYVSRRQARTKAVSRLYTQTGRKHKRKPEEFSHIVNEPGRGKRKLKLNELLPEINSKLTNHVRHRERQLRRLGEQAQAKANRQPTTEAEQSPAAA